MIEGPRFPLPVVGEALGSGAGGGGTGPVPGDVESGEDIEVLLVVNEPGCRLGVMLPNAIV
jgi:hypothetical protein